MTTNIANWIFKQYSDIRVKGKQEVIRKVGLGIFILGPRLYFVLAFPICVVVVLCFRLIHPWLVVRLGIFRSDRLGHFSIHPELYLSGLDCGLGRPDKPFVDLWCFSSAICNQQLAKMWRRTMHIWPRWIVWPLFRVNGLLPGWKRHCIPHPDFDLAVKTEYFSRNIFDRTESHLSFSASEEEYGFRCLDAMGLARGQKFICFHGRDSRYLDSMYPGDWSYHDYRDVTINNYIMAVEELTRRGYVMIRMGSKVRDRFVTSNVRVIDYANSSHQSDFMDIFLSAKCELFISSGSGAFCPSMAFRRPQVIVNATPFVTVLDLDTNILFIPKMHRRISDARNMTCKEIFDSNAHTFGFSQCYTDAGIELVESSPQEILGVVLEAEERYRGAWINTPEDEELQQRFWAFCPKDLYSGPIHSRIGASFLRNNRHLLDR